MFISLLLVTLATSLATCVFTALLFKKPIGAILNRIVSAELGSAWQRYITFAIYVVGISGGVQIWKLEQYVTARTDEGEPIILTAERWTLEVYRTVIETLESVAWMLLVFFVFALIAYVVVRGFELKHTKTAQSKEAV